MIKKVAPLLLALLINGAGHAYFVISLPVIGRVLNVTDLNVGLILSISSLLLILTGPLWGVLCDKVGRKKVLVIGLTTSAISTLVIAGLVGEGAALTSSLFLSMLLSIRAVHAALTAGLKPASQAIMTDVAAGDSRLKSMSLMGVMFGGGTIVGGAFAMFFGVAWLIEGFVIIAVLMAISTLVVALKLPETKLVNSSKNVKLTLRPIFVYFATTVVAIALYSALQPITSWRLHDTYGLESDGALRFTGAIMMSSMLTMIFTQLTLVKLTLLPTRVRNIGLIIAALAMLACTFAANQFVLLLAMAILGVGFGLFLPANLTMMTSDNESAQGKVAGLNGMCQGIGMTIGPIGGTLLYQQADYALYIIGFIGLLMLLARRTTSF